MKTTSEDQKIQKLEITSSEAHADFEAQAKLMDLDPNNPWIGGYTDYEWRHLRKILETYKIDPKNLNVCEFGTNVGASAIIFALLGAKVWAIDIDDEFITLAKLNAERFGVNEIKFNCIPDTRELPYTTEFFDLINCNSVLEYVQPSHLKSVQRELNRILKPGGKILVSGTSSRLWPKEIHTERWLTNYIPNLIGNLLYPSNDFKQGVFPWSIRYGFGSDYTNLDALDKGAAFLKARSNMDPPRDSPLVKVIVNIASLLNVGPGMFGQTISCILQKRAS